MNTELTDLYQQVILDHYRNPRGSGELENATHTAHGHNPLCGDEVFVSAVVVDGKIQELRHRSSGCAICVASASLMAENAQGRSVTEFKNDADDFYKFIKGDVEVAEGKLMAFAGVSKFPMRVKCATLAWHTLENALKEN